MQYVNDDMDDLFRRAAENYPLDTSGADWKKVLAALEGDVNGNTVPEKKPNKNGRMLWLLLLLPLGLICNQLYTPSLFNRSGEAQIDKSKPEAGAKNSVNVQFSTDSKLSTETGVEKEVPLNEGAGVASKQKEEGDLRSTVYGPSTDKTAVTRKGNNQEQKIAQNLYKSEGGVSPNGSGSQKFTAEAGFNEQKGSNSRSYVSGIAFKSRLDQTNTIVANRALVPTVSAPDAKAAQSIRVTKPKKFYAGLIGGLDATTIKLQKIENAGFSYGLLAGYQFNRKWSIETGAYLERKYYYSDGKYFNTSKIYMPQNSRISEVSGDCKMIEVPISARYVFGVQKQSNWFGTAGITSYFMTEENYTYDYYYGTVGPVPHTRQYNNSSTNLFSNISLSAGYNHTLGKFADFRVEPYFKLPISGLGIGSMPLFSMGLQVGVTKKF